MWSRWQREYLTALRERHNLTHTVSKFQPKNGDVVIVKTDSKNRGTCPLAIVNEVYPGNDSVIRAVQLKTAKSMITTAGRGSSTQDLLIDLNASPLMSS